MRSPANSSPPSKPGGSSWLLIGGVIAAGVAVLTYFSKPASAASLTGLTAAQLAALTPAQQAALLASRTAAASQYGGALTFSTSRGTTSIPVSPLNSILNSIFPSRAAATPAGPIALPPVASAQTTLPNVPSPVPEILRANGTVDTPTDSAASGQAAYDGLPIQTPMPDILRPVGETTSLALAPTDTLAEQLATQVAAQDAAGQISDVGSLLPTDMTEFTF